MAVVEVEGVEVCEGVGVVVGEGFCEEAGVGLAGEDVKEAYWQVANAVDLGQRCGEKVRVELVFRLEEVDGSGRVDEEVVLEFVAVGADPLRLDLSDE